MFVRLTKFLRENPGDCYIPVGNRRRLMLTRSTFTSLFLFTNNKTTAIWKCTRFMERRKYTYEYFKYSISLLYHLFSILFLSYFFYFVPFDWPQEHTIHTATQHSVLLLLLLLLFSTSRVCNFERNSDSVFIFLLLFRILLLLRRWPEFWAQIRSPRASLVSFFFVISFSCLVLLDSSLLWCLHTRVRARNKPQSMVVCCDAAMFSLCTYRLAVAVEPATPSESSVRRRLACACAKEPKSPLLLLDAPLTSSSSSIGLASAPVDGWSIRSTLASATKFTLLSSATLHNSPKISNGRVGDLVANDRSMMLLTMITLTASFRSFFKRCCCQYDYSIIWICTAVLIFVQNTMCFSLDQTGNMNAH